MGDCAGDDTVSRPDEWTERGLVAHFGRVHQTQPDKPFCFVLGSGASVSSGIWSGGAVARKWLEELHEREGRGDFEAWLRSGETGVEGLDPDNLAAAYPRIYQRRFRFDPDEGYAWLEDLMDGKRPGFGYSVLADILSNSQHRVVITTNFDNLVADALYTYGGRTPIICGHESLAGFARARPRRPLVVKIHRDLLLAPVNDEEGTGTLARSWVDALRRLFRVYTPIFIGYGGNDGSLMGFLEQLVPDDIPGTPIWCVRAGDIVEPRVARLMAALRGAIVTIRDFDELMLRLLHALGYEFKDRALEESFRDKVARYREQVELLTARIEQVDRERVPPVDFGEVPESAISGLVGDEPVEARVEPRTARPIGGALDPEEVEDAQRALRALVGRTSGWWSVELKARTTADLDARDAIYRAGIEEYPQSAALLGAYAAFLHELRGDEERADALYQRALDADAYNATNLDRYAAFVDAVHGDAERAVALRGRAHDAGRRRRTVRRSSAGSADSRG